MEETLLEKFENEDKTYDEYICYLENLVKTFQGYLSCDKVQNNPILLFSLSEHLNIKPMPVTTGPIYPVFTAAQQSKDDVAKLMGQKPFPSLNQRTEK